jgi:protein required for attachment to host cells/ribosomal protein L7Ae-like RNA K-turn-binding protein
MHAGIQAKAIHTRSMEPLTTMESLRRNIATLACVEATDAPFVSCYLNLEQGKSSFDKVLEERAVAVRSTLADAARADFDTALRQIKAYLYEQLRPDAKGVALFSRHFRDGAFFLPMQFAAPLPNWLAVYDVPNLFHLMALKDTYHRYIVLLATRAWVRILEVNLGAATIQAWTEQPALRERVGREWTKEHYASHRRERTSRFLKEQIDLLGQLMAEGRHTSVILAGDPHLTGEIRRALPKSVASKLIDTIPTASRDAQEDVVTATLSAFVEWEEQDSQAIAARFIKGIRAQGRAVAGATACYEALRQRRADTLLLAQDASPKRGWICATCHAIRVERNVPHLCLECGKPTVRLIDPMAELVRLAGQQDCPVEVIAHCDPLMTLGGIGCLLRY